MRPCGKSHNLRSMPPPLRTEAETGRTSPGRRFRPRPGGVPSPGGSPRRTMDFERKLCDERSPLLRQDGTVVLITQDDSHPRALDPCALRLRMDEGRLVGQHSMENGDESVSLVGGRTPPPPTTRSRWRRFVDRYLPGLVIYLMVLTLVGVVLYPHVVVTVPSGHVGVLWKRFGGGTVLDPRQLKDEGLHLILPWDELFMYDLRLQSLTETYNAISSDGVSLTATINARFRLQRDAIPVLHQVIGPNYLKVIAQPGHRQPDARGHRSIHRRAGLFDGTPGNSGENPPAYAGRRLSEKMMEREGEAAYRVAMRTLFTLYDTLLYGIELPAVRGRCHQSQDRAVLHFGGVQISRRARKKRVGTQDGSRLKASAIFSRSSARASRIPICAGAASRRRCSSRSRRIRRS